MAMTHQFRKGSKCMIVELPDGVAFKSIGYTMKELVTTTFTVADVWEDMEAIELEDAKEDGNVSAYIWTSEQLQLVKGS